MLFFIGGASDHLSCIEIPEALPDDVKGDLEELISIAFELRHVSLEADVEETYMAFKRLHDLTLGVARMLDYYLFDIICDEGQWR